MFSELSAKERILNTLTGKETDRTPRCPFLAYYWETLPHEVKAGGMLDYIQRLGGDPLLRGSHQLFNIAMNNCVCTTKTIGNMRQTKYDTSIGSLIEEYTYSPSANSRFLTGHPVKSHKEFHTLQYLYENTVITPNISCYEKEKALLGEQGLYVPVLGVQPKTAFQALIEHWCGTVDLTYALYDFPEIVEECLAVMQHKNMETAIISAQSSAEAFIFWEDSSTTNISPDFFKHYTIPEINNWGNLLHDAGKLLIHHACGHVKDLLPIMAETPIDVLESISPPPTGNVTLKNAIQVLPHHIGIIGGIEPTVLLNSSMLELEEYVNQLLDDMKDWRYVLANSDSCPPHVTYEKFVLISEIVKGRRRTNAKKCFNHKD